MLNLLLKLDIKIVRDLLQKIDQTANDEILPPLHNFIDFFNCNCIIGIFNPKVHTSQKQAWKQYRRQYVMELYHLSLLPQGTFLATWLYTVRKTLDTRAEKC